MVGLPQSFSIQANRFRTHVLPADVVVLLRKFTEWRMRHRWLSRGLPPASRRLPWLIHCVYGRTGQDQVCDACA